MLSSCHSSLIVATLLLVSTVHPQQTLDCDFTSGNICGWKVEQRQQADLQIMQEEQPPAELRTSGGFDSDYVFVTFGQMVTKSRSNSRLTMVSPFFQPSSNETSMGTRCFSFWYRSASWKRSQAAIFSFNLDNGPSVFAEEIHEENANVWRFKEIDLPLKKLSNQIQLYVDGGDTYFGYVAFDHFKLSDSSCDTSQHAQMNYRKLNGNCPGHYLAQFGEPIGCYKCSLSECMQTCEAFAFCRGVSWVERDALSEAFPANSQCYLKAASCNDPLKFTGGYKFYERVRGFSYASPNATASDPDMNHNFQVLSSLGLPPPIDAPSPAEINPGDEDWGKWLPRNAKPDADFEESIDKWLKASEKPSTERTSSEVEDLLRVTIPSFVATFMSKGTEAASTTVNITDPPTTTQLTTAYTVNKTTEAGQYSLISSPFPNSKHLYSYVPLQPFGNCGGHFIIDENHQYLGCTRCSFAQCATLCSLSDQCRGFSFTESILVAKQCYLKTALTCEPQPSSTGFKYFIKVKKSESKENHVAEASHGKNGIGAFTIKPVMPVSVGGSSSETTYGGTSSGPTPAPWPGKKLSSVWGSNAKYVALSGNCAGSFLRDGSGEAVKCPRCSLAACQKLCDQDDECRGISYTNDQAVAVQCFLKTIDNCASVSTTSSYFFHAKKD